MITAFVILIGTVAMLALAKRMSALADRLQSLEFSIYLLERRTGALEAREATPAAAAVPETTAPAWPEAEVPPVLPAIPEWEPATSPPLESTTMEELLQHRAVSPRHSVPTPTAVSDAITADSAALEADHSTRAIDWEKFLGVKLFAWVGGFALFLGIAFFIKFSFERNLIPPEARVALGLLFGLGLVGGGVLLRKREYLVTSQTLVATGVVVLYAASFAAHALYQLISTGPVFLLMSAITAGAFFLAGRLDARVVGVLGLVGGFVTPPMLSTGEPNAAGLFSYIALLNAGLIALAVTRQWHFLVALGSIGTVLTEAGWMFSHYRVERVPMILGVLSLFSALYLVNTWLENRRGLRSREAAGAVILQAALAFGVASCLVLTPQLAAKPWIILGAVLVPDLTLLALVWLRMEHFRLHYAAGGAVFLLLAGTRFAFMDLHPWWGFGGVLGFAALHAGYPLLLRRRDPEAPAGSAGAFSVAGLVLAFVMMLQLPATSYMTWPVVLLLNLLLLGVSVVIRSRLTGVAGTVLTAGLTAWWMARLPSGFGEWASLGIILFFAGLFTSATLLLVRRTGQSSGDDPFQQVIPAIPALLPFLLLMLIVLRPGTASLVGVFGAAAILNLILVWVARRTQTQELIPMALVATLLLQLAWFVSDFAARNAGYTLAISTAFYLFFLAYPFCRRSELKETFLPWGVSAVAGPAHYYFIHAAAKAALPDFPVTGLFPAVLSIPGFIAMRAVQRFEVADEHRHRLMAWFAGSALFFITLVFPVQFDRQWITLGWALEGVALCWVYHRIPHRGLAVLGTALLVVTFARLGLNPAIFSYYERSGIPILNWHFYTYGIAAACLLGGARLLAPPRNMVLDRNAPPVLYALGTILLFLLVNIQIADYFGEGRYLRFDFSENFARDMAYSVAWSLFALGLLIIGIVRRIPAVRYASIGLIGATLLKLFFHDLSQLSQLYRIGAFIGVAIVLMVASWLYQRFLAAQTERETGGEGESETGGLAG